MAMNINEKRIVFVDLDGTLIRTLNGNPHPKGVWDMQMDYEVMFKIGRMRPTAVFIVSNQGGIEKGYVNHRLFEQKFMYVIASLQDICGQHVFVAGRYCPTMKADDPMRKPNTGMLTAMLDEFQKLVHHTFRKEDCVMIGDMESDRQTAENFEIDYIDAEAFCKEEVGEPLYRIVDATTGEDVPDQPHLNRKDVVKAVEKLNEENPDRQYAFVTEKFICPPQPKPNRQQRRANERAAAKQQKQHHMVIDVSGISKKQKS